MDDKKKIVLGSEDFIAKGIDDIFINVNLQQTFNEIKKEKYDNNFDLAEQFKKERNNSRNFRVYGIVDSNIVDTDNLSLNIFKDSGLTQSIGSINTTPLVYSEQNLFAKKRGKYLLELDSYDSESVFIQIVGNSINYASQVIEQRLVYYTLDGDFVQYGTETVDIGLFNPGFLSIENNFPFFYNKHWIKKDLEIVETKEVIMQFGTEFSSTPEGQSVTIDIVLDKPSPFGNESVVLDAVLGTISPADYSLSISGQPINFPITLTWNQGEQNKTLDFDALTDPVLEFTENMIFTLSNLQFAKSGITMNHYATIEDTTPRRFTNYHLGEIYKNRLEFSGRTVQNNLPNNTNTFQTSAYSILRNGLHFDYKNEAFYPADKFTLVVTNEGGDTILPENPLFGINSEQPWQATTDKEFAVDVTYSGNDKHKVKLIIPASNFQYNVGKIRINGVDMGVNTLRFSDISNRVIDSSANNWITLNGYEKDWSAVVENASNTAITITSLVSGLPVKVDIIATQLYGGAPPYAPANPSLTPYIEEIDPFIEYSQVTKALKLFANTNNNTATKYNFKFQKTGYAGVSVSAKTHSASVVGVNRFLVTSFEKVCRNWNGSQYMSSLGDDCIYSTRAMPEIGSNIITQLGNGIPYLAPSATAGPDNYHWPVGVAHINGSVLITANGGINSGKINLTSFRTADFKPYPLLVNPCTNSLISISDVAQKVKITIPKFFTGNGTLADLYEANADAFRSFDFRTGTTGPYSTIYNNQPTFSNFSNSFFAWNGTASISGATNSTASLGSILEYGSPSAGYPNNTPTAIPSGPFFGLDLADEHNLLQYETDNAFYLESKIPGVPFEITNIKDAFVRTSATNAWQQSVTAGDYTAGAPLTVELIIPNVLVGGDNIANNWMNGYNVDLQLNGGGGGGQTNGPISGLPFGL